MKTGLAKKARLIPWQFLSTLRYSNGGNVMAPYLAQDWNRVAAMIATLRADFIEHAIEIESWLDCRTSARMGAEAAG